jgi:hypothetical protein
LVATLTTIANGARVILGVAMQFQRPPYWSGNLDAFLSMVMDVNQMTDRMSLVSKTGQQFPGTWGLSVTVLVRPNVVQRILSNSYRLTGPWGDVVFYGKILQAHSRAADRVRRQCLEQVDFPSYSMTAARATASNTAAAASDFVALATEDTVASSNRKELDDVDYNMDQEPASEDDGGNKNKRNHSPTSSVGTYEQPSSQRQRIASASPPPPMT